MGLTRVQANKIELTAASFIIARLQLGRGPRASPLRFINVTVCQHSLPATAATPHTLSLRTLLAFALPQRCAADTTARMH